MAPLLAVTYLNSSLKCGVHGVAYSKCFQVMPVVLGSSCGEGWGNGPEHCPGLEAAGGEEGTIVEPTVAHRTGTPQVNTHRPPERQRRGVNISPLITLQATWSAQAPKTSARR